jgi:hypothetical protein
MDKLKELVQGKIYYLKTNNGEDLIRLDSPGFPLTEESNEIKATFRELASTHYFWNGFLFDSMKYLMQAIKIGGIMHEVPLHDLPLYVSWPNITSEFMDLIRKGDNVKKIN